MTFARQATRLTLAAWHSDRIGSDQGSLKNDNQPRSLEIQSHEVRARTAETQTRITLFLVKSHPCVGDLAPWCPDELAQASDHHGHHASYTMGQPPLLRCSCSSCDLCDFVSEASHICFSVTDTHRASHCIRPHFWWSDVYGKRMLLPSRRSCSTELTCDQSDDTIDGMINYELDAMFMYTVTMGLVGLLMAWEVTLLALKGWAVRNESRNVAQSSDTARYGQL